MEDNEKELTIFENCPSLEYIVNGYTLQDLGYVAVICGAGVVAALGIYFLKGNTLPAVFAFAVIAAFAVMFFRRDRYLENCIDKLRQVYIHTKCQKKYEYEYKNIYEKEGWEGGREADDSPGFH